MVGVPSPNQWDTSDLPHPRRAYLDCGLSFDEIVNFITANVQVTNAWCEPCSDRPPVAPERACRICFRIRVSRESFDLFYNAADGLRGRYWQGPDIGFLATKSLIGKLKPTLLSSIQDEPLPACFQIAPMSLREAESSLDAISAKAWVREKDDAGNTMIDAKTTPQLLVRRWVQNESVSGSKGPLWRWTPRGDEIEIKGAFVSPSGEEYIPED